MRLNEKKEVWFKVPDDPEKGEVLIRHLNKAKVQAITTKLTDNRTSFNNGRPETVSIANSGDIVEAICLASIIDWKNVYGLDGKSLECTDANKRMFINESDGFLEFINQCRNDLSKMMREEDGKAEKN